MTVLIGLGGCGEQSSEKSSEGEIVLEFWTIALGDAFADYIHGMIATYEAEHPDVRIKWVDVSGAEVGEKFIAALVADDPPDVANVYDLPRFLEHGVISNMDQLVPAAEVEKRLPVFWRGVGQYQGANYVIPWYASVNMMWYNRALFRDAGLDPGRPPKTLDEMFAMGQQIRQRTGKYGVSWRLHPNLVAPPWVLLRMEGVWPLFDESRRRTTINSPKALSVFEQWVEAYRDKIVPPESLAASSRDEVNWFIEGRAAMLPFSGGWITRYFDPSFEKKAAVAPQPRGRADVVPATNQVLVVPRASSHPHEATDFALFVTNDKNQLEFCRRVSILPSTKAAAADPYFRQPPQTLADAASRASARDLPNSFVIAPPDVPGWSRLEDILHEEFAKALAGEQTSQQALQRIEDKWNYRLRFQ
ncbi:MAG: sugar ABC transporter substrate-binding protein [Candidatus Latescibacterota bacterium]|nr:sugar ABC transporter substrate-binding protein [Candidatus Latescibacterota bacterium]